PSAIRQATRVANPAEPIIGNWVSAQRRPIASNTHRVGTRLTRNPVATDDTANSRKKLEPTKPNWRGPRRSSCIIGTAAIPITALSAKLITMKMNSSSTTSHARLRSSARMGPAFDPADGFEHRGEDTEPALEQTASQIGSKLGEVRPHHDAKIEAEMGRGE